ncbi:MAG: SRPBCC domain-containing protein [Methanomassiliicoccus sp.]|nr:SRPBCC domain-containing protein [Methanomassiliicoccus sp.]
MSEGVVKGKELIIQRTFKADPKRVWTAWTDPETFKAWWGPRGFTTPVSRIDLRVGGKNLSAMRSPDGKDFWSTGTYKEIVPMSKIVVTDSFADAEGNVVPASNYGMPGNWPLELLITVTFREKDGGTEMELVHEGLPEGMAKESTKAGWNESFDKLDEYLATGKVAMPKTIVIANPGVQELLIRRTFDAPRQLAFKALTDPELIPQWWGPAMYKTTIDKLEARAGGAWRFRQKDDKGNEFAFRGVFHTIRSPELIIQTFEYEPMADHVELQTATLEEKDGRTLYNVKSVYLSVEDRDGELNAGMEAGMNEGFDRLDALLEKMKRG